MWWPSLISVLNDLWVFCFGRTTPVVTDTGVTQLIYTKSESLLTDSNQCVFLSANQAYAANSHITERIRYELQQIDPHLVSDGYLTEKEWLLYMMLCRRRSAPLLSLYMTPVGHWYTTLKGQAGIAVSVTPYTGALMEWQTSPSAGRAALVTTVSPDETITIGELTGKQAKYEERTLKRADWLELRPVFTALM